MEFRISDTFTESLGRLTGDEQKSVKTTAFDLQMDPAGPGMQFHKLDKAKDKNFWSVRVNRDIRVIVHRTAESVLLCYVDHHDRAYAWAERRRLETHPKTGAAQWVEVRERVEEIVVPKYVDSQPSPRPSRMLFEHVPIDDLMKLGVPLDWVGAVREATEDTLLDLASHLPGEAAEALLTIATGGVPTRWAGEVSEAERALPEFAIADALQTEADRVAEVPPAALAAEAFSHPDAQRRFRTIADREELERALEYPWEKWSIFLHPAQRESVERTYGGPARISGSAGTGKTIVALHRAVFLARANPDARVLLTTFSETLATALRTRLRRLIGNEPRLGERLEVHSLDGIARRLYERNLGSLKIAPAEVMRGLFGDAADSIGGLRQSQRFVETEWNDVVDAWQLTTWDAYRDVARLGRKTRLPESQRKALWEVFERTRAGLAAERWTTTAEMYGRLAEHFAGKRPPFEFVVTDEAQDIGVAQLRLLGVLGAGRPDALFFAGDLGQRIFQQPFSWKGLGVDIRGRSRTLRVNYRTSHQIRAKVDRLLGPEVADVDGEVETRRGTISVFNGPEPQVEVADSIDGERDVVARWLKARIKEGINAHEAAVFVRSGAEMPRARAAAQQAGLDVQVLDGRTEPTSGRVSVGIMHLAKGLEFRAVAVMACDDGILPLQSRIEAAADDSDLEDMYNTERHLLYVACTRARDTLLVTAVEPASEFIDDFLGHDRKD